MKMLHTVGGEETDGTHSAGTSGRRTEHGGGGTAGALSLLARTVRMDGCLRSVNKLTFNRHGVSSWTLLNLLAAEQNWNWEAFALSESSGGRPLSSLTYWLLERRGLVDKFRLNREALLKFLQRVESYYNSRVAYHNATHAADVVQSLNAILVPGLATPLETLGGLLAAAIHDVNHPGMSNDFLVRSGSELARVYGSESPMERHSAYLGLELMSERGCDFLCGSRVSEPDRERLRGLLFSMVVDTDMKHHDEKLRRFSLRVPSYSSLDGAEEGGGQGARGEGVSSPKEGLQGMRHTDIADRLRADFAPGWASARPVVSTPHAGDRGDVADDGTISGLAIKALGVGGNPASKLGAAWWAEPPLPGGDEGGEGVEGGGGVDARKPKVTNWRGRSFTKSRSEKFGSRLERVSAASAVTQQQVERGVGGRRASAASTPSSSASTSSSLPSPPHEGELRRTNSDCALQQLLGAGLVDAMRSEPPPPAHRQSPSPAASRPVVLDLSAPSPQRPTRRSTHNAAEDIPDGPHADSPGPSGDGSEEGRGGDRRSPSSLRMSKFRFSDGGACSVFRPSSSSHSPVRAACEAALSTSSFSSSSSSTETTPPRPQEPLWGREDMPVVLGVALKLADLGHLMNSPRVHSIWTSLLQEENFRQGDLERAQGREPSCMCDRRRVGLAGDQEGQLSFITGWVKPLVDAWRQLVPQCGPMVSSLHLMCVYYEGEVARRREQREEAEAAAAQQEPQLGGGGGGSPRGLGAEEEGDPGGCGGAGEAPASVDGDGERAGSTMQLELEAALSPHRQTQCV